PRGPSSRQHDCLLHRPIPADPLRVQMTVPSPPPPPPGGSQPAPGAPPEQVARRGWTGARITSLVAGSLLFLVSLGLLAGGGLAIWADNTQRDAAGYLTTSTHSFASPAYALTSDNIDLGTRHIFTPSALLATIRLRLT